MTQRDTAATIDWYRSHETTAAIGFNPDGMCQKICRTARNIGPGAASALASALMTPAEHRVHRVEDIRRGMVGYFDDPNDSNPFGHVVTWVGRVKGADRADLGGLLCRTNSVLTGRVVVVRGDYFSRFWEDPYQFSGTWLNGEVLDLPDNAGKPKPPPALPAGTEARLRHVLEIYNDMIEKQRAVGNERGVRALRRDKLEIRQTIDQLGNRARKETR